MASDPLRREVNSLSIGNVLATIAFIAVVALFYWSLLRDIPDPLPEQTARIEP